MHWSDKYVGEPYAPSVGDCAALASKISKIEFGKDIGLPTQHAESTKEQTRQILELKNDYATRIDKPFDGCPVLFITQGGVCHIGVMCWIGREWWVVHADRSAGFVVRQRLRELTRLFFKVEGFYQWI